MKALLPYLFICIMCFILACNKPMAFEYRDLRNLRLENLSGDKSQVSLNLIYYNPNSFGVDLKNVNCNVFIDSMYVGKFNLDTMMHISRNAEFSLPAHFEVSLANVLKSSINILFNEVTISAQGTTRVGKAGFYKTIPIRYSRKQKLNLF